MSQQHEISHIEEHIQGIYQEQPEFDAGNYAFVDIDDDAIYDSANGSYFNPESMNYNAIK